MSPASEFRFQVGIDYLYRCILAYQAIARECNYIGVIVRLSSSGELRVHDKRGTYVCDLVGGDGHADAGAAHEDSRVVFSCCNGFGRRKGEVRVII